MIHAGTRVFVKTITDDLFSGHIETKDAVGLTLTITGAPDLYVLVPWGSIAYVERVLEQ